MLSKKFRLNRYEIKDLKSRKYKIFHSNTFSLVYKETPDNAKIGVIVSIKVAGKAVERNRIRRLFYKASESLLDKKGNFLFLANKMSINASLEEIIKETEELSSKIV